MANALICFLSKNEFMKIRWFVGETVRWWCQCKLSSHSRLLHGSSTCGLSNYRYFHGVYVVRKWSYCKLLRWGGYI